MRLDPKIQGSLPETIAASVERALTSLDATLTMDRQLTSGFKAEFVAAAYYQKRSENARKIVMKVSQPEFPERLALSTERGEGESEDFARNHLINHARSVIPLADGWTLQLMEVGGGSLSSARTLEFFADSDRISSLVDGLLPPTIRLITDEGVVGLGASRRG